MNEEEIIRQRKMEELRRRMELQHQQEEIINKAKKDILIALLDKQAYSRLGNVRLANPELAEKVEAYLILLYQQGKLRSKVTDAQLKNLLSQAVEKRDFRIMRR